MFFSSVILIIVGLLVKFNNEDTPASVALFHVLIISLLFYDYTLQVNRVKVIRTAV